MPRGERILEGPIKKFPVWNCRNVCIEFGENDSTGMEFLSSSVFLSFFVFFWFMSTWSINWGPPLNPSVFECHLVRGVLGGVLYEDKMRYSLSDSCTPDRCSKSRLTSRIISLKFYWRKNNNNIKICLDMECKVSLKS